MYILELISELIKKNKTKDKDKIVDFALNQEINDSDENEEDCNHIFIPIDSTKQTLACSKCGYVIKASDIPKNKNFFVKD